MSNPINSPTQLRRKSSVIFSIAPPDSTRIVWLARASLHDGASLFYHKSRGYTSPRGLIFELPPHFSPCPCRWKLDHGEVARHFALTDAGSGWLDL